MKKKANTAIFAAIAALASACFLLPLHNASDKRVLDKDEQSWMNEHDMHMMRDSMWKDIGVKEDGEMDIILINSGSSVTCPSKVWSNVIAQKGWVSCFDSKTNIIGNIPEIAKMIKRDFPSYHVQVVNHDLSIEDQVQLLSRARVMISLPGSMESNSSSADEWNSLLKNAFLLRDDATLLMYCRKGLEGNKDIDMWFYHHDNGHFSLYCDESEMTYDDMGNTLINVEKLSENMKKLGINELSEDDTKVALIDDSTRSEVICHGMACMITKACVGEDAAIKLFGDDLSIKLAQSQLEMSLVNNWVANRRHIITERGTGTHNITAATGAIGAGLNLHNCGHILGDVLWPVIRLNLMYRDVDEFLENAIDYLFLEASETPCDNIYDIAAFNIERYQNVKKDICFDKIFVGSYLLNFMNAKNKFLTEVPNFHRDMRVMRSMFWKASGVKEDDDMDTVLIYRKKSSGLHVANIANIPEVVDMIEKDFPQYNVKIVSWEDFSLQEQVHLMARTKIMIALPGSAYMNAFLMRDNAALLGFCQKDFGHSVSIVNNKGLKVQGSNEYRLWFDHFDYGNFVLYCDDPEMTLNENHDTVVNVTVLSENMKKYGA